ncbi:Uncharacterized membrane protein YsdA, DUF1294 family [Monaibacterium marinum]|uniref:Uncharacterized membrane protein YsdA, DUF1294 family n=1 Tax=Pontivivens marinum TaxID=1690039 RepID=A0A2C9CMU4_9RHOB|nr:DUF1294 domain-containing protein [Monaibacterium marinum]SOH92583.1 Uncharacterized membrane protein YsdA, DUF1294 family [Monaibacterium marinum]
MDAVDFAITAGLLVAYFAWMNYWTYQGFAQDKARSLNGEWRIPEHVLLWWAAYGGAPAAFYARKRLRHKTRKEPFSSDLRKIAVWQAIWVPCLLAFIFWVNPVGLVRQSNLFAMGLETFAASPSEVEQVERPVPVMVLRRSE